MKALGAQSEVSGSGRNFPQGCNLETLPEFPAFRLKTAASTLARASPSNPARALCVSRWPCVSANPDDYTWRLVRPSPREPSRREQEGTRSGSARCCTAFRFRGPVPIDRSSWNPGVGRFRNLPLSARIPPSPLNPPSVKVISLPLNRHLPREEHRQRKHSHVLREARSGGAKCRQATKHATMHRCSILS